MLEEDDGWDSIKSINFSSAAKTIAIEVNYETPNNVKCSKGGFIMKCTTPDELSEWSNLVTDEAWKVAYPDSEFENTWMSLQFDDSEWISPFVRHHTSQTGHLVSYGADACSSGNCGVCSGDCDGDADCAGDLKCFER